MTQARGSFARLVMVREVTPGTTPATPAMVEINSALYGESLGASSAENQSNAINSSRSVLEVRNGQFSVSGSVPFELPVRNAEMIYEGALGSGTTTGAGPYTHVFKVGGSIPSFTFGKEYLNNNQYFYFTGCKIGSLQFTVDAAGVISGSFDVMGMDMSRATSPLDASPTTYVHQILQGPTDAIVLEGAAAGKFVSINININNNLQDARIIGNKYTENINEGRCIVTGTLRMLFEDAVIWDKWFNETLSSLRLTCTRGAHSTEFYIPSVRYSGNGVPKIENEQGIEYEISFQGIYDVTEASPIVITVINDKATID